MDGIEGSTKVTDIESLREQLGAFAAARDWDQFHSPKNLAMALAGEVGELLEHFQWLTEQQSANLSADVKDAVALEMADVLLYLVRLADKLEIDLGAAALRKIGLNAVKYPAAAFRGSPRKYDDPA